MMQQRPDWRWVEVQSAIHNGTIPEDSFLRDIYNVIEGNIEHKLYKYVLSMYYTHRERDTLIAWFISGADLPQIMQGTGVTADALNIFEKLYIDPEAFRNKMEWRAYAEYYVSECCADETGEKQVKIGVLEGPIPLLYFWQRGNEVIRISDTEVLTQQTLLAYVKATAARNASITDPESKEALRWGQFAVSSAAKRNLLNDPADVEVDAIVAIQKRRATLEAQEAGLDIADIAH